MHVSYTLKYERGAKDNTIIEIEEQEFEKIRKESL